MKELEETHWTENADTLERFVLDRLEPAERSELENHLRVCETCQEAVRTEEKIAAGVRRLGRDELKLRLKQNIESRVSQRIPWRQIASVAAVVLITVSVGIYRGWFIPEEQHLESMTEKLQTTEELPSIPPSTSKRMAGKDISESKEITASEPPSTTDAPPTTIPSDDERTKTDDMAVRRAEPKIYADKKQAEQSFGAVEKERRSAATTLQETAQKDKINHMANEADVAGSESLWIAGSILPQSGIGLEEQAEGNLRTEQPNEMGARINADRYRTDRDEKVTRRKLDGQTITLSQRRLSDLPAAQQIQADVPNKTVQTLIERTGEGLHLTMFLDPPLTQAELDNASIETIRDDSLIVNLPNQSIGYHIVGGWGAQVEKARAR